MKQKINANYTKRSMAEQQQVPAAPTESKVMSIVKQVQPLDSKSESTELVLKKPQPSLSVTTSDRSFVAVRSASTVLSTTVVEPPVFHPHWKLVRVLAGHNGWVRTIDVEPNNNWMASGANDNAIFIWDLKSGKRKITYFKHTSSVTQVKISARHPYLFSCGEDKQVFCWDLEQNKIIRHYHGHLSGIYSLALHPALDLLFTGGRDSSCRVWDMRSQAEVMTLTGHTDTVMSIIAQAPFAPLSLSSLCTSLHRSISPFVFYFSQ